MGFFAFKYFGRRDDRHKPGETILEYIERVVMRLPPGMRHSFMERNHFAKIDVSFFEPSWVYAPYVPTAILPESMI